MGRMTIREVAREAAAMHLTYGQYVARFRPPGGPRRRCVRCGADISGRRGPARYCPVCSELVRREHNSAYARQRRELRRTVSRPGEAAARTGEGGYLS